MPIITALLVAAQLLNALFAGAIGGYSASAAPAQALRGVRAPVGSTVVVTWKDGTVVQTVSVTTKAVNDLLVGDGMELQYYACIWYNDVDYYCFLTTSAYVTPDSRGGYWFEPRDGYNVAIQGKPNRSIQA